MKRILLSIAATLALAAVAMPTRDEQKDAAPIVAELMNPLVADFRAKKKTAVEVGDTAMAYAKEANTEGAKFLLLKGAIWYFAQAKEDLGNAALLPLQRPSTASSTSRRGRTRASTPSRTSPPNRRADSTRTSTR